MSDHNFAIFPQYEAFYIQSMLFNTRSAVRSVAFVNDIMNHLETNGPNAIEDLDVGEILDELQNIILQGAAVSRYFWPARNGFERRAEKLRLSLGIDEGSALRNRDLRNAVEHFDEHLDRYLENDVVGNIIPECFDSRPTDNGVPLHLFRGYYINTGEFVLLGKEFKIQPIADALWKLHQMLEWHDEHGGRLTAIGESTEK